MTIPKILHQLWIGYKTPPTVLMETWKTKHPDWQYILWNEAEFEKRGMQFECFDQMNIIKEINGKADIMRWEILHRYGGIFVDADSICLESLDPEIFLTKKGFACYENETERGNLIATVAMGFIPGHPLVRDIINWIKTSEEVKTMIVQYKAWYSVGPGAITRFLETGKYKDVMTILPSHYFLPTHFTGNIYDGHKKVYGYQEWGTTFGNYDTINDVVIPKDLVEPEVWVSILISSYNTARSHIRECLDSIRDQYGRHIGFEVVWVNDGSDDASTTALEAELRRFLKLSRFCKVAYYKMHANVGVAECLRRGVEWCSHELIVKMDSDDVMVAYRILEQYNYMMANPAVPICGSAVLAFQDKGDRQKTIVFDQVVTWDAFKSNPKTWLMSQPSTIMRKSAVLEVGNYRDVYKTFDIGVDNDVDGTLPCILEDYDLQVRLLKRYGFLVNLSVVLLNYRLHPNQVTYGGVVENSERNKRAVVRILEDAFKETDSDTAT